MRLLDKLKKATSDDPKRLLERSYREIPDDVFLRTMRKLEDSALRQAVYEYCRHATPEQCESFTRLREDPILKEENIPAVFWESMRGSSRDFSRNKYEHVFQKAADSAAALPQLTEQMRDILDMKEDLYPKMLRRFGQEQADMMLGQITPERLLAMPKGEIDDIQQQLRHGLRLDELHAEFDAAKKRGDAVTVQRLLRELQQVDQ